MRIIFSRKGFDQSSGGAPSPIVNGRPVSLPIPAKDRSRTTYRDLGLGELVERATRGRIGPDHLCHEDPVFAGGRCAFGQTGAAQSHLANQSVGVGDVFLFFGLFGNNRKDRHHRIFGYMKVERILRAGAQPAFKRIDGFRRRHPHTIGTWHANNTIYLGPGALARRAPDALRLTDGGGTAGIWRVPPWLRQTGLTYHADTRRWLEGNRLQAVSRGQEFVAHADGNGAARRWLKRIIAEVES